MARSLFWGCKAARKEYERLTILDNHRRMILRIEWKNMIGRRVRKTQGVKE